MDNYIHKCRCIIYTKSKHTQLHFSCLDVGGVSGRERKTGTVCEMDDIIKHISVLTSFIFT